jgi:hypothetical protein
MDPLAHYRSEAARCRELAAKSTDPDAVKRWLQLAADYEKLARDVGAAAQVQRGPVQQQRQQQQSKAGPEEPGNEE